MFLRACGIALPVCPVQFLGHSKLHWCTPLALCFYKVFQFPPKIEMSCKFWRITIPLKWRQMCLITCVTAPASLPNVVGYLQLHWCTPLALCWSFVCLLSDWKLFVTSWNRKSFATDLVSVRPCASKLQTFRQCFNQWHVKCKGKVPLLGLLQHYSLWLIVLLTPKEFLHSSLEALHTKRRERPQLAKEGTIDGI
jgi:hypothetical protein